MGQKLVIHITIGIKKKSTGKCPIPSNEDKKSNDDQSQYFSTT